MAATPTPQAAAPQQSGGGSGGKIVLVGGIGAAALYLLLHKSSSTPPSGGNTPGAVVATSVRIVLSSASITQGDPLTIAARVLPASGTAIPMGSISFTEDEVQIGSAALDGTGLATLVTTSLLPGTHGMIAKYIPSGAFAASVSGDAPVTVTAPTGGGGPGGQPGGGNPPPIATKTMLSAAPTSFSQGQSCTLTAEVVSGGGIPTGTVTFTEDGTVIGVGNLVSNGAVALATYTTNRILNGPHGMIAKYPGQGQFAPSESADLAISVTSLPTFYGMDRNAVMTAAIADILNGPSVTYGNNVAQAADAQLLRETGGASQQDEDALTAAVNYLNIEVNNGDVGSTAATNYLATIRNAGIILTSCVTHWRVGTTGTQPTC